MFRVKYDCSAFFLCLTKETEDCQGEWKSDFIKHYRGSERENPIMARKLMLQGTMSNVGKTLLTAGLCRILRQDGYVVMPFKAQNMSLNSCITADGSEISRAQVLQAEAAGAEPTADMNPLLLKPTGLTGSQVILQGHVLENMTAADFYRRKAEFFPSILESFRRLEKQADILLIEGAGSPVELNLRKDDLVNMGFAEQVDAPVLLIGDIDPGGVFAQLLGTLELLTEEERARVKGLIVNKFRGDRALFEDGVRILEERSGLPVVGVVPYMDLALSDEDSMSERLRGRSRLSGSNAKEQETYGFETQSEGSAVFDIAVIRYPRISNFTDFDVFDAWPDMSIRYVTHPAELGNPDLLILPGSKNTMADLTWMRETGMDRAVLAYAKHGPVFGICGGYQMLGETIDDPWNVEQGGIIEGLRLLETDTVLETDKTQGRREGVIDDSLYGALRCLRGCRVSGYEIHMGRTVLVISSDVAKSLQGTVLYEEHSIYGTYLHGFFDAPEVIPAIRKSLAIRRGITLPEPEAVDYVAFKEREYDRLAEVLRSSLDMKKIYEILDV